VSEPAAPTSQVSRNVRGALWMLGSALAFTLMTTLVKFLGDDYSPALQTFYRQVAATLVLLPIMLRDPKAAFATSRPGILLYRALVGTFSVILAFYAYQELPLAEANALSFTRTLWIVPLAVLVLRETIGPWRIGATLIGFGGVLLILQPTVAGHGGWPAIAALASSALFATTITGMKIMTRDHSVLVLTVWSAVLGLAVAIPFAIMEWRWPTWPDLALLAAMGVGGLVAQMCYIKGMSIGDAVAMAPIDYSRLLFALAVGFILFQDIPNPLAMLGAAIVVASTLFITFREARLKLPKRPPSDQ
jgi:drug/metabolite transporter (DMT)-like permease